MLWADQSSLENRNSTSQLQRYTSSGYTSLWSSYVSTLFTIAKIWREQQIFLKSKHYYPNFRVINNHLHGSDHVGLGIAISHKHPNDVYNCCLRTTLWIERGLRSLGFLEDCYGILKKQKTTKNIVLLNLTVNHVQILPVLRFLILMCPISNLSSIVLVTDYAFLVWFSNDQLSPSVWIDPSVHSPWNIFMSLSEAINNLFLKPFSV